MLSIFFLPIALIAQVLLARSSGADLSASDGTHYSSLAAIDRTNVRNLGLAWEFDDFVVRGNIHRGMQATPLVVAETPPFAASDKALLLKQPKPSLQTVLKAWDPIKGATVWRSSPMPFWSGGVLATAGDLVVQGAADGFLVFYDASSGRILRHINIGTGIMAAPMTYSLGGRQYIAVLAGIGGAMSTEFPPGSAGNIRENSERLLVFALGGRAVTLPAPRSTQAASIRACAF